VFYRQNEPVLYEWKLSRRGGYVYFEAPNVAEGAYMAYEDFRDTITHG